MNLHMTYDQEVDALRLWNGEKRTTSTSIVGLEDVVLDLADEDSRHVVGLEILGADAYLPLGKRDYDPKNDTLTLGAVVGDPACISESGDIVTYWREAPDVDPVGVLIRQASRHLNGIGRLR